MPNRSLFGLVVVFVFVFLVVVVLVLIAVVLTWPGWKGGNQRFS